MPISFSNGASDPRAVSGLNMTFTTAWNLLDQPGGELPILGWHAQTQQSALALFVDLTRWRPWLADAASLLDETERGRVRRMYFERDRDERTLAYALHRLTLARVLACDPAEVTLRRDPAGRPCLPDDALYTSLSHAGGAAAIAISVRGPVGIDLEPAARAEQMPEIAARIVHRAEAAEFAALAMPQRSAALLALWVRKEALLKAAGIGLAREMDTFEAPAEVPLPAEHGPDGTDAVIHMLDAGADWVAAVAGVSMRVPPVTTWLHPQAG